jgi:hypothetical protein
MAKFIDIKFDVDFKDLQTQTKRQQDGLRKLPKEAYQYFVAQTPVRSGNARRNTRLIGDTIRGDYAYAGRLDDGFSQQSPRGMSKPTADYVDKRIKEIFRKR